MGGAVPVGHEGAAAGSALVPVVVEVTPAAAAAIRALGPDLGFFTSRRHPLASLSALRRPGLEVASPHLQLGRGLLRLLRAGGAPIDPGATDLMTLLGPRHLATTFAGPSPVTLLLLRQGAGAAAEVERSGGVRVVFRDSGSGKLLGGPAIDSAAAAPGRAVTLAAVAGPVPAAAELMTSFGPVRKVEAADQARQRHFETSAGATVETRRPRPGHHFVTLHVARDFSRGVGTVSFLYGSGIIVQPAYDRLQIEAGGKKLRPAAVFDEGPTLELAYEIPVAAARLFLIDGEARLPLGM